MLTAKELLPWAIFIAGFAQFSVLLASACVPVRLQWRTTLSVLPRLYRQLVWCYAGYIVLSIIALGLLCVTQSTELANSVQPAPLEETRVVPAGTGMLTRASRARAVPRRGPGAIGVTHAGCHTRSA